MKTLSKKEKRSRYIRWQQQEPSRKRFFAHLLWRLREPQYP